MDGLLVSANFGRQLWIDRAHFDSVFRKLYCESGGCKVKWENEMQDAQRSLGTSFLALQCNANPSRCDLLGLVLAYTGRWVVVETTVAAASSVVVRLDSTVGSGPGFGTFAIGLRRFRVLVVCESGAGY